MIALIDIDGTIADCSHRLGHIIGGEEPDWDSFFDAMSEDSPIRPMIDMVRTLAKGYSIYYVTGRPESHREVTIAWLTKHGLPVGEIFMRTVGDRRPDFKVKRELFEAHISYADIAIEDRKQVVDMWRSIGITTLQPKDGDY